MAESSLCLLLFKLSGLGNKKIKRGGAQNVGSCHQSKNKNLLLKEQIKIGEAQKLKIFKLSPCPLVNGNRDHFLEATPPKRDAAVRIVHLYVHEPKT